MIELRTLGSLSLTHEDGREARSVLAQPKRLALLAYLASPATPRFVGRETLLGVFWPELDEERARRALRTSLHFLRHSLGNDLLDGRGEHEVGVRAGRLLCDAAAFEEKLDAGEPEASVALYGGEYLAGLSVDGTPDFERWLETERRRLARRALKAVLGLARAAAGEGDSRSAESWARQALTIDAWDEEAVRLLMKSLDREGKRAEALITFERFSERLASELELRPSPETQALAARLGDGADPRPLPTEHAPTPNPDDESVLRNRSERSSDAGDRTGAVSYGEAVTEGMRRESDADPYSETQRLAEDANLSDAAEALSKWRRITFSPIAILSLVAGIGIAAFVLKPLVFGHHPSTTSTASITRVAILYFDGPDPERDLNSLATGVTEAVIKELDDAEGLDVISEQGVLPFRNSTLPLDSISRALKADLVVNGRITRSDGEVRAGVHLVDTHTGTERSARVITRPWKERFAMQDELTREVSEFLRVAVGEEVRAREWRAETKSEQAWRAVSDADAQLKKALKLPTGRSRFEALLAAYPPLLKAMREDTTWAVPCILAARLAEHLALTGAEMGTPTVELSQHVQQIGRWADRANQLGGGAEALYLRGESKFLLLSFRLVAPESRQRILEAAAADFRAAIAEKPKSASALGGEARLLAYVGDLGQAHEMAARAQEANSFLQARDAGPVLFTTAFHLGHDEEAEQRCTELARKFPGGAPAVDCELQLLAWSRAEPDLDSAWQLVHSLPVIRQGPLASATADRFLQLAVVAARVGLPDSARAIARWIRGDLPREKGTGEMDAALALVLHDTTETLELIRVVLAEDGTRGGFISNSRFFQGLHEDVRFQCVMHWDTPQIRERGLCCTKECKKPTPAPRGEPPAEVDSSTLFKAPRERPEPTPEEPEVTFHPSTPGPLAPRAPSPPFPTPPHTARRVLADDAAGVARRSVGEAGAYLLGRRSYDSFAGHVGVGLRYRRR